MTDLESAAAAHPSFAAVAIGLRLDALTHRWRLYELRWGRLREDGASQLVLDLAGAVSASAPDQPAPLASVGADSPRPTGGRPAPLDGEARPKGAPLVSYKGKVRP